MNSRAWTDGPWYYLGLEDQTGTLYYNIVTESGVLVDSYAELSPSESGEWIDPEIPATGKLIALAPEMAEWFLGNDTPHPECICPLCAEWETMRNKILEIGQR